LAADAEVHRSRLSHEQSAHGEVDGASVEIQREAEGRDDAEDSFGYAEALHMFECGRERGGAGCGGESDEEGFAGGGGESSQRDSGEPEQSAEHDDQEQQLGSVGGSDEARQAMECVCSVSGDCGSHGRGDSKGREIHHVAGVGECGFSEGIGEANQGCSLGAGSVGGDAEQEEEDDHLEDVAAGHGVDDAVWEYVFQCGRDAGLRGLWRRGEGEIDSTPRREQGYGEPAEQQGDGGGEFEQQ